MRLVLDTNVLVSAWLWHGTPHSLLECVRNGAGSLIVSAELLAEFTEVLARPKFRLMLERSGASTAQAVDALREMAETVVAQPLDQPVCRDPDDDHLLALARTTRADLLVSGDEDLLTLDAFEGIPIVSPAVALAKFRSVNP